MFLTGFPITIFLTSVQTSVVNVIQSLKKVLCTVNNSFLHTPKKVSINRDVKTQSKLIYGLYTNPLHLHTLHRMYLRSTHFYSSATYLKEL